VLVEEAGEVGCADPALVLRLLVHPDEDRGLGVGRDGEEEESAEERESRRHEL
jgi:hypothetical protein